MRFEHVEAHAHVRCIAWVCLFAFSAGCVGPSGDATARTDAAVDSQMPSATSSVVRRLVADAATDVELRPLVEGVWIHTSYFTFPNGTRFPANGLVVRDGDALTLADSAWGEVKTVALLEMIESTIGLPVTRAVVTHSHTDRGAGIALLKTLGVEIVVHPLTLERLHDEVAPAPDRATDELESVGSSLAFGAVEVVYPGPGHAPDNLMVWLPEHALLFGGCALRSADAQSLGNLADADIASWARAIAGSRDRYPDVRHAVPGHGGEGDAALLERTAALLESALAQSETSE